MIRVVESASGAERLDAVAEFLSGHAPGTEVVVVGPSRGAVDDLVRALSARHAATFGLHRFTLTQLAARLAAPRLTAEGLATCTRLAAEAVAARATFAALAARSIPFFAPVAPCPGFARTLAATLGDLRAAGVGVEQLQRSPHPLPELGALLAAFEAELATGRLADRTALLRRAEAAIADVPPDPLVGLPLVLLDLAVETRSERDLVRALCAAAPQVLASVPRGDGRTRAALTTAVEETVVADAANATPAGQDSLRRLQSSLFADEAPPAADLDDTVRFFSAPGEGRESVEIARAVLAEARAGTPFDQMVVFLRSPETYTPLLESAFRRAGIPAYFARGTRRPNPSGRAFLALLACAADGLSAKRFAEYLSFGQVPPLDRSGAPPSSADPWTGPRDEALGAVSAAAEAAAPAADPAADADAGDGQESVPAPWRWEELLVDAAVLGGAERWRRRLDGLARELALQQAEQTREDADSPRLAAIARDRRDLDHLRRFVLPIIEDLAALPAAARWGEWLARLTALAPRVLRHPAPVLRVLAELTPMGDVGPVALDEARDVLGERLRMLTEEPPDHRYGRILVTTLDDARGRSMQVAFVPALAERVFPQRPREDALLLDARRAALSEELARQGDRIDRERLLLRLAVGAAERRVYLSYPRLDVVQGRARVTSFYGLDVARATRGEIPDVELFEREATAQAGARLAWPAPPDPAQAIDAAEHDLATLAELTAADARAPAGSAQYLVELNPHLARSLRTRYARWEMRRWQPADGLVRPGADAQALLATHRLTQRAYSPSALQHFAACPYRFFLAAIQRLEPRREIVPLEQLDPLTRGKLFHRVQAETLRALAAAGAVPVTAARLETAERVLAETMESIAARYYEELAPAIRRVWDDEVAALRADLSYWLRHLADDAERWHPAHFELGFGVDIDDARDPHSRADAVALPGGWRLRGAVDLVERSADGATLRVTDHKTGADRSRPGLVVAGGETLQPVLYALAVETMLEMPVREARLFYCTARGGFSERVVNHDERARIQGRQVLETIDAAIGRGFLPPAPRREDTSDGKPVVACDRCDFHLVCGPHEEERVRRKNSAELADLAALRVRP